MLSRGSKGGRGRRPWAIYSRPWHGGGARVALLGGDRTVTGADVQGGGVLARGRQ
jgi:hypothetical protein